MNKIDARSPVSMDDDFALWCEEQAALLRAGRLDRLDIETLAEEIASLGRSDRYEIEHRLAVLLAHLLKWQVQPEKRSNSWRASIAEQRRKIARLLRDSPSLKPYPALALAGSYIDGLDTAVTESGLPETLFPSTCPYTIEQVLDDNFLPLPA